MICLFVAQAGSGSGFRLLNSEIGNDQANSKVNELWNEKFSSP